MRIGYEWCLPADAHTTQVKPAGLSLCWCHCKTLFATCAHATSDTCRQWPMSLANAHTPCLMPACLGIFFLTLASIIFHVCICYACTFSPRLMFPFFHRLVSPILFTHTALTLACTGRRLLTLASHSFDVRICYARFVQALNVVFFYWPFPMSYDIGRSM